MKALYNSAIELKIDIILEHTNWFDLIINDLGLAYTYEDARFYIDEIKEKRSDIRKRWLANPTYSFPYVLLSLDILDKDDIKQAKKTNLIKDIDWQYQTIKDMYEKIPERQRYYLVTKPTIFGIESVSKRFVPIEKLKKRQVDRILYKDKLPNIIKEIINNQFE
jgi:hypothetical protein